MGLAMTGWNEYEQLDPGYYRKGDALELCGRTPAGLDEPACYLDKGHGRRHESAGYWWLDGEEILRSCYRTKSGKVITDDDIERWAAEAEHGYDISQLRDRVRCGRCGQPIRLVPWGLHYKWVSGKDTWKCQPTAEFPVRSHHPGKER